MGVVILKKKVVNLFERLMKQIVIGYGMLDGKCEMIGFKFYDMINKEELILY